MKKLFAIMIAIALIVTCFAACGTQTVRDGGSEAAASDEGAFAYDPGLLSGFLMDIFDKAASDAWRVIKAADIDKKDSKKDKENTTEVTGQPTYWSSPIASEVIGWDSGTNTEEAGEQAPAGDPAEPTAPDDPVIPDTPDTPDDPDDPDDPVIPEDPEDPDDPVIPDDPEDPDDPGDDTQDNFTFKDKVRSDYMVEVFGEEMVEAWYNMVDAVLAGEDTFECPDTETYNWIFGQFPDRYFPVFTEILERNWDPVENGIAHISYKYPKEQCALMIQDFRDWIEDILAKTMQEDMSDFEKVLSLYRYFYSMYSYDWDTFNMMASGMPDYVRCYRLFEERIGICQEVATAYSYMLLQVGVDATVMMGPSELKNYNHRWSYIKINGKNYHVDPTYVLSETDYLGYLMMNDEERSKEYLPENYVICSNYSQDHPHPDYVADDDHFSELWDTYFNDVDWESDILYTDRYPEEGGWELVKFDYSDY